MLVLATTASPGTASWQEASGVGWPAGVRTVATSGGQYTTIESALSGATAGTTILVFPGTYAAPAAGYTVTLGVSIVGLNPSTPVLGLAGTVNIDGSAVTATQIFSCRGNQTIANLSITSVAANTSGAVRVTGTGVVVDNVVIKGASLLAPGIKIESTGAALTNIFVEGSMLNAILTSGVSGFILNGLFTVVSADIITGDGASYLIDVASTTVQAEIYNVDVKVSNFAGIRTAATLICQNVSLTDNVGVAFDCVDASATFLSCINVSGSATFGLRAANTTVGLFVRATGCSFRGTTANVRVNVNAATVGPAFNTLPARSGIVVMSTGTSQVTVPYDTVGGTAYEGMSATAVLAEADAGLAISSVIWPGAGGVLTINATGNMTGDRDVRWFVDGECT